MVRDADNAALTDERARDHTHLRAERLGAWYYDLFIILRPEQKIFTPRF